MEKRADLNKSPSSQYFGALRAADFRKTKLGEIGLRKFTRQAILSAPDEIKPNAKISF